MSQIVVVTASHAPALIAAGGERASYRFFEFFTANITWMMEPRSCRRTDERNSDSTPESCWKNIVPFAAS